MERKRFFVDKVSDLPVLRGDEHKHLSLVLRAKVGDEVVLCTGDGYDYICIIDAVNRNETLLHLCKKEKNASDPSIEVSLFMSVLKGDKNELVVQKAVELGASEIYPIKTRYVQGFDRNFKPERLNKIAIEAAKQCGRSIPATVHDIFDFSDLRGLLRDYDSVVFPYEKAQTPSLKEFMSGVATDGIKKIAIIIGSEGGFSDEEARELADSGITPVTLGKRILRAETANIAVLAAVMYELGQWQ